MKVKEIIANGWLDGAIETLIEVSKSQTARVPIRMATLEVASAKERNDSLSWSTVVKACQDLRKASKLQEDGRIYDKAVLRFVFGKPGETNDVLPAYLLLMLLHKTQAEVGFAIRPNIQFIRSINDTFQIAEHALSNFVATKLGAPTVPGGAGGLVVAPELTQVKMEEREWGREVARAMAALRTVLRAPAEPGRCWHHLFTKPEHARMTDDSYYVAYRYSASVPNTLTASFVAVRQVVFEGHTSCVFTSVSEDRARRTGRFSRGGVIAMAQSVYFLGGCAKSANHYDPQRRTFGSVSKGIEAFVVPIGQLEDHETMPTGTYLSNKRDWSPIAGRFCMLHLGYRSDSENRGKIYHTEADINLHSLDRGPDGQSAFRSHLARLDARFDIARRNHMDLDDIEDSIFGKLGEHAALLAAD